MSEKIKMGFIGVAGRGYGALMQGFAQQPDMEITAVCDVYQPHLDRAVAFTGGRAEAYHDYRELLARADVEAVAIATPPHWHALIALDALAAGKDVYCEKPMCRYPAEGRLMVDYAAKYGRITQVGTQIHATENYHKCVDVVRSGALGRITAVRNFCAMNDNSEGLGTPPDTAVPDGLDWDRWIGPAPETPFNSGRFRDGMHRYYRDYVDSWLHELGPHIVELPFWALELGCPRAISAAGGRYATHSSADVPDTVEVDWEFDDLIMTFSLMQSNGFHFGVGGPGGGRRLGIVFHGTEGTLLANYGLCQVLDKQNNVIEREFPPIVPRSPGHEREFLDSIRSRQECSCSFANHLPMHTALNLAHTALETGRKLHWDEQNWQVIGDEEANAKIVPHYRAPYMLPVG
jgi:predicted dehydrogenase